MVIQAGTSAKAMKQGDSKPKVDVVRADPSHDLFFSALYTQLTDRQLPIDKRLALAEQQWNTESKQMIFDWLSGLVINRKK